MSTKKDILLPTEELPPPSYEQTPSNYYVFEDFEKPISECNIYIRTIFQKRVFKLLFFQISFTFLVQVLFYNNIFSTSILSIGFVYWTSFIGSIITLFSLLFAITPILNPDGEIMNLENDQFGWLISYNKQLFLLFLFTCFESILIAFITIHYNKEQLLTAVFITLVIIITAYTISSYKARQYEQYEMNNNLDMLVDEENTMSMIYKVLWCLTSGLFAFGFVLIFIPHSSVAELIFSWIGAVMFTVFLFVDMYMVFRKVRPNEEIKCCIMLYTDIINLFLNILRIVSRNNND